MKYDLAIVHRVCPALAKTAYKYTDKFAMVRDTTASLADALRGIKTKLVVILDGCDEEYERLFDDAFAGGKVDGVDYERVATLKIGNHATYRKQLEILADFTAQADNLYLSEDDYIYERDAFRKMMAFLQVPRVDFVSPLDHPDFYMREAAGYKTKSCEVDGQGWKTTGSTCCTFMFKGKDFQRVAKPLSWYADGGSDFEMWTLITKDAVFSPWLMIGGVFKYLFGKAENRWMFAIPAICWAKFKWRLLVSPRFTLWSPVPTLAVHLCVPSLPPGYEGLLSK